MASDGHNGDNPPVPRFHISEDRLPLLVEWLGIVERVFAEEPESNGDHDETEANE